MWLLRTRASAVYKLISKVHRILKRRLTIDVLFNMLPSVNWLSTLILNAWPYVPGFNSLHFDNTQVHLPDWR